MANKKSERKRESTYDYDVRFNFITLADRNLFEARRVDILSIEAGREMKKETERIAEDSECCTVPPLI